MTRKASPHSCPATVELQFDGGPPKTPPVIRRGRLFILFIDVVMRKFARRHVDRPIGRQPLEHVVMARDGHESTLNLLVADGFSHRRRTDARHIPIHYAREFIEHYKRRPAAERSGQIAAKLLAVAEYLVGFDPRGR